MSDKVDENKSDKSKSAKKPQKTSEGRKDGRLDHVVVRNLFALNVSRRVVLLVFISALCAALSLVSAFQVYMFKTPPQYIQLTEDGRIFPVSPLNVANVNDGEVLRFATDSVKWLNTYDYHSWKDQLQATAERFTPKGWSDYLGQLTEAGTMNTVKSKNLVVYPEFNGPSRITKSGVAQGGQQFSWVVEVPVSIHYENTMTDKENSTNLRQTGVVTMYISRVPLEINLRGYAIVYYQFDTTKTETSK